MPIPPASKIIAFQAPSTDKLLARCETMWNIVISATMEAIKQDQRELRVPLKGEGQEILDEVLEILRNKDLGYDFAVEGLDETEGPKDDWTTGYLVFKW